MVFFASTVFRFSLESSDFFVYSAERDLAIFRESIKPSCLGLVLLQTNLGLRRRCRSLLLLLHLRVRVATTEGGNLLVPPLLCNFVRGRQNLHPFGRLVNLLLGFLNGSSNLGLLGFRGGSGLGELDSGKLLPVVLQPGIFGVELLLRLLRCRVLFRWDSGFNP